MKWIVLALSLSSVSAFANTNPQDCLKVKNGLDRKYCIDKYLESVKDKNETEKKSWGKGLPQKAKDDRAAAIEADIQTKKDMIGIMQSEIALSEKHLAELKGVAVAKKDKKEKKEKKKGGFRIKL